MPKLVPALLRPSTLCLMLLQSTQGKKKENVKKKLRNAPAQLDLFL